jgi:hypothetical protein
MGAPSLGEKVQRLEAEVTALENNLIENKRRKIKT